MATTAWSPDLRHPVYATRVLCEVANERGISTTDVLAGTGISQADLDNPEAVVTAWDEIVAVRRLLARLPDDAGVGRRRGQPVHDSPMPACWASPRCRARHSRNVRHRHALLLADDAAHRPQAVRGSRGLPARTQRRPSTADVRRFFIERDLAGIVATVGVFAYAVVERYADQVTAEVSLDKESAETAADAGSGTEHFV